MRSIGGEGFPAPRQDKTTRSCDELFYLLAKKLSHDILGLAFYLQKGTEMKTRLTSAERLKLAKAETFEELFEVAVRAIERMYQTVDLVSGPVSTGGKGSKKRNIAVFKKVINWLSRQGYVVFDQMPFEKHMWRIMRSPYFKGGDHLFEAFYGRIFSSGLVKTIHMIHDWRSSYGAKWEHRRAKRHKIEIHYL